MVNVLLSADADAVVGAEWGQPSPTRTTHHNGYRHRELDTRAGTIDVAIPKLRQGTFFPSLLERRRRVVDDVRVTREELEDRHPVVVDRERQPADFIASWRAWCEPRDWSVSQQGRKIYAMPHPVTKSAALAHVRERLIDQDLLSPDAPVLAAGDGRLDADLLAYADLAIRPRHGELEEAGWTADNLRVTASSGIMASEEILRWFAERSTLGLSAPHSSDAAATIDT